MRVKGGVETDVKPRSVSHQLYRSSVFRNQDSGLKAALVIQTRHLL